MTVAALRKSDLTRLTSMLQDAEKGAEPHNVLGLSRQRVDCLQGLISKVEAAMSRHPPAPWRILSESFISWRAVHNEPEILFDLAGAGLVVDATWRAGQMLSSLERHIRSGEISRRQTFFGGPPQKVGFREDDAKDRGMWSADQSGEMRILQVSGFSVGVKIVMSRMAVPLGAHVKVLVDPKGLFYDLKSIPRDVLDIRLDGMPIDFGATRQRVGNKETSAFDASFLIQAGSNHLFSIQASGYGVQPLFVRGAIRI